MGRGVPGRGFRLLPCLRPEALEERLRFGVRLGVHFTPQQQASRYALLLTARIEFIELKENKVLWQNPAIQFREEFDVATTEDVSAFLAQNADALQRVATEFARTIVSAILEAF